MALLGSPEELVSRDLDVVDCGRASPLLTNGLVLSFHSCLLILMFLEWISILLPGDSTNKLIQSNCSCPAFPRTLFSFYH